MHFTSVSCGFFYLFSPSFNPFIALKNNKGYTFPAMKENSENSSDCLSSADGLLIRSVTPADAESLLAIYGPYITDTAITFEYDIPSIEEFRGRIQNTLKSYPYICAQKDGQILGYAYAGVFKARAAYMYSVELSIYVKKDFRGCGIGKKLYTELEKQLKNQGIKNLYACIAVPTKEEDQYLDFSSQNFHSHMGFSKVGTFTDCAKKFDRWYSMIWMEKILSSK